MPCSCSSTWWVYGQSCVRQARVGPHPVEVRNHEDNERGPPYEARYDLDADSAVNVLDILLYKPFVNTSCTNP